MERVGVLHHCHCSSFGASSSGKATWWEVLEKFAFAHSSGSGSKAQGLDHACPLGPGARSARLHFSVLGLKRFGLSHSLNLIETLCTDASFSQGKQVSVPILLGMRGRLSRRGLLGNVKCTFRGLETLGGHKDWFGRSWEALS